MSAIGILGTAARYALGGVRLVAGSAGLLAPAMIISRFGDDDPGRNPAAIYGLRLFGIRTVLIGAGPVPPEGAATSTTRCASRRSSTPATPRPCSRCGRASSSRPSGPARWPSISGANTLFAGHRLPGARRSRA